MMDNKVQVFKMANIVMVVDGSSKKIISNRDIVGKSEKQILEWYLNSKKPNTQKGGDIKDVNKE